nr:DUF6676 family protein [Corynebacterium atrinae]
MSDLARQLNEDTVAFAGANAPQMEVDLQPGLIEATSRAANGEAGSLGVVVFDWTPGKAADLRDVAQDLMDTTGLDTVIVRAPGGGAVVSDIHSRAVVESAQATFLSNWDYVGATQILVDDVANSGMNWIVVAVAILAFVVAVTVVTAWAVHSALRARLA